MDKKVIGLFAGLVFHGLSLPVANAIPVTEVGDAGELMPTAQELTGMPVTSITGTLSDLGVDIDDIDLYKISIIDPDAFSVTVSASLSEDNDAMMFLFDAAGTQVLQDDDGSGGLLPQFDAGALTGNPQGDYFLGFSLFSTSPAFTAGSLSGWNRNPEPFQTGPYTLTLTGVSQVPIPAAAWLFGSALLGLGVMKRKKA